MAAGPDVTESNHAIGRATVIEDARGGGARPLSRQERILLGTALAIALLAVLISIVARLGAQWPLLAPSIVLSLFTFGLGGIAGATFYASARPVRTARSAIGKVPVDFAALLDAMPAGIAVWDKQGHLLRVNESYSDFLELAAPHVILGSPRNAIRALGGRPLDGLLIHERDMIRNGRGTFRIERTTGPNGQIIEIITDITRLNRLDEAATEADARIRHLVNQVAQLTSQIEDSKGEIKTLESRLAAERERADAAVHAKTDFLSHMSHELRTPLNAIIGFADMMRGQIFGPLGHDKYEEYAGDIYASGEELLRLIADILDVSQIQSGDLPIDKKRIDLEKTITDCLDMVRPRIYASGIALMEHIDHLPSVFADPMAVRQILMHILSNAMKFTPTGGRISIKAEADLNNVVIIIDDTGIGIAPDIMEKLDQPFSMIDHDALISGDEGAGLGVGLSVGRALARLNGGALHLESEEGYGTTVRITLPRR